MLIASLLAVSCQNSLTVYDLKCEGLEQPLGIDNVNPHFSWKTASEKPVVQQSYEIEVASDPDLLNSGAADLWRSGSVESFESVMVPYAGTPLASRQLCFWRVRIAAGGNVSPWSAPQRFSVGILPQEGMNGEFVGLGEGQENAVLVEKRFELPQAGKTAFLHVNSLGYHEAYVNGTKVTDAVLVPAVSQLDKRSLIVTYDVTGLLREGENSLVLWIGSGWYKKDPFKAQYDGPAVRADLDILQDGRWNTVVKTDATWRGSLSGYSDPGSWRAWRFSGEIIDARMVPTDLSVSALDSRQWRDVDTVSVSGMEATPQMCRLNKVKEVVQAVSVSRYGEEGDSRIVDFGKVMNGMMEVKLPSIPAGTEIEVLYEDHLNEDGTIPHEDFQDRFITSGASDGDIFVNKFNHQCFRYVLFRHLPASPQHSWFKALRFGYDADVTGTFECSDPDMNAIHQMLVYTMDNLAFGGYMVDCAHIERLGYGGDGNASTLSLQNNFDVAPMYMNWLQAWNDVIREDGGLPHTAPSPYRAGGGPYWCSFIVQAPWRVWMNYGDDRLLHRCYPSMRKWLEYVDAYTVDGLLDVWPNTDYRNWYLGDWLAPSGVDVALPESVQLVNNCALVQSYNELIQIAGHLGLADDVREYQTRRDALCNRINEKLYHPDTDTYGEGVQLDMTYPMLVGAVPAGKVSSIVHSLKTFTAVNSSEHLRVGLVGVPVMAEWATVAHEADYLYQMLKQEDYPGYLYMLRNGATGTWEDWDNPRSYLHNCFNGMDSWFYQALGGIIPMEPGYRTVLIDPQCPDGIDWVKVTRETPYGTIKVEWRRGKNGIETDVVLPNGVKAIQIDAK